MDVGSLPMPGPQRSTLRKANQIEIIDAKTQPNIQYQMGHPDPG